MFTVTALLLTAPAAAQDYLCHGSAATDIADEIGEWCYWTSLEQGLQEWDAIENYDACFEVSTNGSRYVCDMIAFEHELRRTGRVATAEDVIDASCAEDGECGIEW